MQRRIQRFPKKHEKYREPTTLTRNRILSKGGNTVEISLSSLRTGERGTVTRIPPAQARSLSRLGLCPGTEVVCLRHLPLGDPTVYRWRDTSVALRRRDATHIKVIRKK